MANNDDLFDDSTTDEASSPEYVEQPEEAEQSEDEGSEEESTEGEDTTEETPASDEEITDDKSEKMIPVHRFKAALKEVSDELALNKAELAKYTQGKPVAPPDRATDPDGHDLHVRIETSKAVMREAYPDYDAKIAHYQEMVKTNPYLNDAVAKHPTPAKYAYDLAKKSLEIAELSGMKDSAEWKEFQAWKKTNKKVNDDDPATPPAKKVTPRAPNLNRATSASLNKQASKSDDDELFNGAL